LLAAYYQVDEQEMEQSVYHLSNQVGYAVLPDLFFNTIVYNKDNVDSIVDDLDFNNNVKAVLKRKLYQFIVWKEKTEIELKARRKFQIKYLRQHYTVIKSYMSWVKPYLKHINRLTMDERQLDSPDLISSFETSATEIEVIAVKPINGNSCRAVMVMHYFFTTRPILQYNQEYQKGPVHVGRGRMTLRSYGWTQEQIEMYRRMKDNEDRELLGMVDDQLKAAMEMLGKDLEDYLQEAEASIDDKNNYHAPLKRDKLKAPMGDGSVLEPFIELFRGFWDIGKLLIPTGFGSKSKSRGGGKGNPKKAAGLANKGMWLVYKNYKKANKMLSW